MLDKVRYACQYYYGVTDQEFFSPSREGNVMMARRLFCYIGYVTTSLSFHEVASYIEKKTHVVARHHFLTIKKTLDTYADLREDVQNIMYMLMSLPPKWNGTYLDFRKFVVRQSGVSVLVPDTIQLTQEIKRGRVCPRT